LSVGRQLLNIVCMRKVWRVAAVVCMVTQIALPTMVSPCPRLCPASARDSGSAAPVSNASSIDRAAKASRCKSGCRSCARKCAASASTRLAATSYRSACVPGNPARCTACPCRQPWQQGSSPYLPSSKTRNVDEQVQPAPTAVAHSVAQLSELVLPAWTADVPTDSVSHNERQSQIACWLK
jgi:hypothetical protein